MRVLLLFAVLCLAAAAASAATLKLRPAAVAPDGEVQVQVTGLAIPGGEYNVALGSAGGPTTLLDTVTASPQGTLGATVNVGDPTAWCPRR